MTILARWRAHLLLAAALTAITAAVFFSAFSAGFLNMDDPAYVMNNPHIRQFSVKNTAAIFSSRNLSLYTPLSTFSYTFDYAIDRLNPAVFHTVNIALHTGSALLVFLLASMLGLPLFPAWTVAALFAVHPLHVESVAWIAERKDVLYGFLYLLSIILYLRFLEKGGKWLYAAALLVFILSALAKPMAVTLPAALALCDWYKNGAQAVRKNWKLLIPFAAVAAGFIAITLAPALTHTVDSTVKVHLTGIYRFIAPIGAWGFYAAKTLWPANLSAMYPTEGALPLLPVYALFAAALLTLAAGFARKDRALTFGLAFFTVTLLPVIQLVPFGPVLTADRYTYIPALGIFMFAGAFLAKYTKGGRATAITAIVIALAVISALGIAAHRRCSVWKNNLSLWTDTVKKTPPNATVFSNTGVAYMDIHAYPQAEAMFKAANELEPANAIHIVNLAAAYYEQGLHEQAFSTLKQAQAVNPAEPAVLFNLARMYGISGNFDEAAKLFTELLSHRDYRASAFNGLGMVNLKRGNAQESAVYFKESLQEAPDSAATACMQALALAQSGEMNEAIAALNHAATLRSYPQAVTVCARSRGLIKEQLQ